MTKLKRIYLADPEVFFPATAHQAAVAGQSSEHRFLPAELVRRCVRELAHA